MNRRQVSAAASAVLVGTAILGAQSAGTPSPGQLTDPDKPVYFEAASVRQNTSGDLAQTIRRNPGGRLNASNMPLRALITFAYQLQQYQLVNDPAWTRNQR